MSTNASMAMFDHETEKYHSVYLHNDGYPSHVLPILNEHFGTYEKAKELLEFGDLSVLGSKLTPDDDSDGHNYETQIPDVCVFYTRDRGEPEMVTETQKCLSKVEIQKQEFNYFFEEVSKVWSVERE